MSGTTCGELRTALVSRIGVKKGCRCVSTKNFKVKDCLMRNRGTIVRMASSQVACTQAERIISESKECECRGRETGNESCYVSMQSMKSKTNESLGGEIDQQ